MRRGVLLRQIVLFERELNASFFKKSTTSLAGAIEESVRFLRLAPATVAGECAGACCSAEAERIRKSNQ